MLYKEKLSEINNNIKGNKKIEEISIRTLLSWFGFKRRTYMQSTLILSALDDFKLTTVPEFDRILSLDSKIKFIRATWKQKPTRWIRYQ